MLNNLKIKSKVLLVFALVIALLAILAAVAFVGNTMTGNDLNGIDTLTTFQTTANDLVDHFYDARIGATIICAESNDAEYERAVASYTYAVESLALLKAQAEQFPEVAMYSSNIEAVDASMADWMGYVDGVQDSNTRLDEMFADFSSGGTDVTGKITELYTLQLEIFDDLIKSGAGAGSLTRQRDNLKSSADFMADINALRRAFLHIADTLDVSGADAGMDSANALLASIEQFTIDNAGTRSAEVSQAALEALQSYEGILSNYVDEVNNNNEIVTQAKAKGAGTLALVSEMMAEIDAEANAIIDASIITGNTINIAAIAISAFAIVMGIILALILSRGISRPVVMMANMLGQIGTNGSLEFSPELSAQSATAATWKDEIGDCSRAVKGMVTHLLDIENALKTVASGDLRADVTVLSAEDAMGMSLRQMVTSLNNMFGEIGQSTEQVSTGAKQIADGSQTLAQGSTEQAAAVEELSSSISEIADKTKENADMAGKAATLANTIMRSAENGSRQMGAMMDAVKEINQASQSINKVIKVIDDIAFQTNILALNAAVEAARAGQHGKGFAVVAEEVRNLAGKSAEAAKDTGVLIVNSIEKAELGARIADDTAASLNEIVSGINENTRLLAEIAKSSEEQSVSIGQINQGIDQVAQVVQQNSATAEESAAASEEMSGQAEMLQQLIAQFKLKDARLL